MFPPGSKFVYKEIRDKEMKQGIEQSIKILADGHIQQTTITTQILSVLAELRNEIKSLNENIRNFSIKEPIIRKEEVTDFAELKEYIQKETKIPKHIKFLEDDMLAIEAALSNKSLVVHNQPKVITQNLSGKK